MGKIIAFPSTNVIPIQASRGVPLFVRGDLVRAKISVRDQFTEGRVYMVAKNHYKDSESTFVIVDEDDRGKEDNGMLPENWSKV